MLFLHGEGFFWDQYLERVRKEWVSFFSNTLCSLGKWQEGSLLEGYLVWGRAIVGCFSLSVCYGRR